MHLLLKTNTWSHLMESFSKLKSSQSKLLFILGCGLFVAACGSSSGTSSAKKLENLGNQALEACVTDAKSDDCTKNLEKLSSFIFTQLPEGSSVSEDDVAESVASAVDLAAYMGKDFSGITILNTKPDTEVGSSVALSTGGAPTLGDLSSDQPVPLTMNNPGVPADGAAPVADPDGEQGWYFSSDSEHPKINWYFLTDFAEAGSVAFGDVESISADLRVDSSDSEFILGVYTTPQGDEDDRKSWFRSRVNYSPDEALVTGDQVLSTNASGDEVNFAPSAIKAAAPVVPTGGGTWLSGENASLDGIAEEAIKQIGFGTATTVVEGETAFLLKKLTLKVAGKTYTLLPVAYGAIAANNFQMLSGLAATDTLYYKVASGTETFNAFTFKVVISGSAITLSNVDGSALTLAQKTLVEKLNRGESYDAFLPEAVYNPATSKLEYDLGTVLSLADIKGISVKVYTDKKLKDKLDGAMTLDSQGEVVDISTVVAIPD